MIIVNQIHHKFCLSIASYEPWYEIHTKYPINFKLEMEKDQVRVLIRWGSLLIAGPLTISCNQPPQVPASAFLVSSVSIQTICFQNKVLEKFPFIWPISSWTYPNIWRLTLRQAFSEIVVHQNQRSALACRWLSFSLIVFHVQLHTVTDLGN